MMFQFSLIAITLAADPLTCSIDGAAEAKLSGIATNGDLALENGKSVPANEWFSLQFAARPPFPVGEQAILANGDRLPGSFLRGDDTCFTLKVTTLEVKIPLVAMDVLWIAAPPNNGPAFASQYRWITATRKFDLVLLATGETLAGDFERFTPQADTVLKIDGKSRTLPKEVVRAIAFNPALTIHKPPTGATYRVVSANGMRLTAKSLSLDVENCEVTTAFDAKLTLPRSEIVSITRWSKETVSLSSLKPSRVQEVPFGAITWHWTSNQSVKNNPLMLLTSRGVETFESGLGTHARTALTYDLAGNYRTFESLVGLDAATGRRGAVVLKIMVDDKVQIQFAPLCGTDGPKPIRVDVAKAKTLTLVTDFGPEGDTQTDVDWADARLRR